MGCTGVEVLTNIFQLWKTLFSSIFLPSHFSKLVVSKIGSRGGQGEGGESLDVPPFRNIWQDFLTYSVVTMKRKESYQHLVGRGHGCC